MHIKLPRCEGWFMLVPRVRKHKASCMWYLKQSRHLVKIGVQIESPPDIWPLFAIIGIKVVSFSKRSAMWAKNVDSYPLGSQT